MGLPLRWMLPASKYVPFSANKDDPKTAIIVPGYGMALAQAQHLVNNLAKKMKANGTAVKYVVHPVAGRMPGHMDVCWWKLA